MTTAVTSTDRFVLAGGAVHDPANGRDGIVADI